VDVVDDLGREDATASEDVLTGRAVVGHDASLVGARYIPSLQPSTPIQITSFLSAGSSES
jgi:hypothetical protein